jgi:transposase
LTNVFPQGAHVTRKRAVYPDPNPIKHVFAKIKHLMRNASPRAVEAAWRKAGELLDLFAPTECTNDLRNAGYAFV